MALSVSRLSPLQRDLLEAFFEHEQNFYLTGGSALAGFHLGHRESKDLDLFASPPVDLDLAERALEAAARSCNAVLRSQIRYPEFRRLIASRGDDTTLIDLVIDTAPGVDPQKLKFGHISVDSMREIAANKICTILGRCEIRDLVDLRALLAAGIDLQAAVDDASKKDAGVNPATIAWLLSELSIGGDAIIPAGVSVDELNQFREDLIRRLRLLAFPEA